MESSNFERNLTKRSDVTTNNGIVDRRIGEAISLCTVLRILFIYRRYDNNVVTIREKIYVHES